MRSTRHAPPGLLAISTFGGREVTLSSGVHIRCAGPVADAQILAGVVCVLLVWRLDRGTRSTARIRLNNLYGFDERGRRLWRVEPLPGDDLGLVLTAFVEEAPLLLVHEARGWHLHVSPKTGRIVGMQRVT